MDNGWTNYSTYHGILFSLKMEWNSDTCYNMDETWGQSHRGRKNDDCQGLEKVWKRKLLFNRYKVSVLQDEKSSIDRCGNSNTAMWMYLMSLNCTIKND